jgi:esterase
MSAALATTVLTAKPDAGNGLRSPTRTMFFLHGLLGTRSNWRGIARKFVDARPDWAAVLVDLREHGDSLGLDGPDTIDQCAADLEGLIDLVPGAPVRGALGHSFGGKVAMRWAMLHPGPVDELWVIDSTPSVRDVEGGETGRVLEVLKLTVAENPDGFADREAFTRAIVGHGQDRPTADWLSMNLGALPNGRRGFRLDLARIERLFLNYGETDTWACLETSANVAFIGMEVGGRSKVVDADDRERIEHLSVLGRNVRLDMYPDAGHSIHVDAPGPLLERLTTLY